MTDIFLLTTNELVEKLREGQISSVEVCTVNILKELKNLKKMLKLGLHFDKKELLEKAAEADEYRKSGKPLGALHGLPVAVKDIIGTLDMPTECGTVFRKKMTGAQDAEVVNLLKDSRCYCYGKNRNYRTCLFSSRKNYKST